MKGRIVRDITPSPENMRNSEGSFITLKDGSILFAYSRYADQGAADECACDIYGVRSFDNGESFGEPFLMYKREDIQATNIMSVSLQRMANGDLGMFFLAKRDPILCLPHLVRSGDEGETWSEPVCCVQKPGYYVLNNHRVIRLPNGRLLAPIANHPIGIQDGKMTFLKTPAFFEAFASDDDGYTWFPLNEPVALPFSRAVEFGVMEPGAVVLKDGRIWCFIRTELGRQYETFSEDNGVTWTTPAPSVFTCPVAPMSAARLSDGRIMAVWNPIPLYPGNPEGMGYEGGYFWNWGRTPLVYALSEDETETFSRHVVLETGNDHGYCYSAIYEVSDGVLLGYNAGGIEDGGGMLNRLRIRKIPKEEL